MLKNLKYNETNCMDRDALKTIVNSIRRLLLKSNMNYVKNNVNLFENMISKKSKNIVKNLNDKNDLNKADQLLLINANRLRKIYRLLKVNELLKISDLLKIKDLFEVDDFEDMMFLVKEISYLKKVIKPRRVKRILAHFKKNNVRKRESFF
jgi:hypothetical protein